MSKILVVDDEASIIRMLTFALKKEGYTVISASNGVQGVEIAKAERPNLIISDIMMPEMDGLEMCQAIREIPFLADTPFIFLTAKGDMGTQIKGLQFGADDFIIKPIDFKLLKKKVSEMLNVGITSNGGLSEPELFHEVHLSGNFPDKKPGEVFQSIEEDRLTGVLSVHRSDVEGAYVFYKGQLIEAGMGDDRDKEAVFALLSKPRGSYQFVVKPVALEEHTPVKISTIVMEWTARVSETEKKEGKKVLKGDTRFTVIHVEDFFTLTANPDVQKVLKHINLGETLGQIVRNVDLDQSRVLKIISYLIAKDILRYKK